MALLAVTVAALSQVVGSETGRQQQLQQDPLSQQNSDDTPHAAAAAAAAALPYTIFWKLGETKWEPPPYDPTVYGFDANSTMVLDVFGEHPTWPDIKGHDRGADGKPCGGWPPREEFACRNFSWTNATCRGNPYEGSGNWYRDSHRTDLGPLCCNAGGCVPQEANRSRIVEDTKRWVAQEVPAGFSGQCVLDQEGYNAIATDVQFGECDWPHGWSNVYRNYSLALVRAQQPDLPEAQVAEIARQQWTKSTVELMVASINAAREVRPSCKWGYYSKEVACSIYTPCAPSPTPGADPLCGYDHPVAGPKFRKQAEALLPVVQASDILFPSAYLMSIDPRSHGYILGLSGLQCDLNHWSGPPCTNHSLAVQRAGLRSIIGQALRSSAAVERKPPVVPFIWQFCSVCNSMNTNCAPCYNNISTAGWNESFHVNQWGIEASLTVPYELGAAGVVVWVDIEEVNQPQRVASVLHDITGPIGQRLLGEIADCSRANCSGHGRCAPLHSSTCECLAGYSGAHCGKRSIA